MKLYYEILRANITPEVLGKLKKNKIILESTSQKQIKGRYSIGIRKLWFCCVNNMTY